MPPLSVRVFSLEMFIRVIAAPKMKGKIARTVATKTALSVRVDALGESTDGSLGLEHRAKVEARLMQLEGKAGVAINSAAISAKPTMKKVEIAKQKSFNPSSDLVLQDAAVTAKRKAEDDGEVDEEAEAAAKKARKAAKKAKKAAKRQKEE